MPIFNYRARDKFGVATAGSIEAASQIEVVRKLNTLGFVPLSVEQKDEENYFTQFELWSEKFERVKPQELIVFIRQLASVIKAGIPLLESLGAIVGQIKSAKLRRVVIELKRRVEGGSSFSDALAHYPGVFADLMVSLVRAGEKAGVLDEVLDRIAEILEKDKIIADKVKAAVRYPMFVLFFLTTAFFGVVTLIIPRFLNIFKSRGAALPLPTQILVWIYNIISNYWFIMLLVLVLLIFLVKKSMSSKEGKLQWEHFIFSLPVFGSLIDRLALSRFTRTLAAMLKSGIPIVDALEISSRVADKVVISQVIDRVRGEIIKGHSFAEQLQGSRLFPPMVIQMVAIGEKSGNLEEMLIKISEYFDRETDFTISNLTSLIEPILILALAVLVGLLALGVMLPMWNLYQSMP